MLNDAQIKKLQNKVGKKVNADIQAREEKEKQRVLSAMIDMRKNIQELQKVNSDRGSCLALWEGKFYKLNSRTNKVEFIIVTIKERILLDEPIYQNGKKYYFVKKEVYENNKKITEFMSKHYAIMRMASVQPNFAGNLQNVMMLGGIFEEFKKEFPESDMLEFIQIFKTYDAMVMQSLQNLS